MVWAWILSEDDPLVVVTVFLLSFCVRRSHDMSFSSWFVFVCFCNMTFQSSRSHPFLVAAWPKDGLVCAQRHCFCLVAAWPKVIRSNTETRVSFAIFRPGLFLFLLKWLIKLSSACTDHRWSLFLTSCSSKAMLQFHWITLVELFLMFCSYLFQTSLDYSTSQMWDICNNIFEHALDRWSVIAIRQLFSLVSAASFSVTLRLHWFWAQ